MFEQVGGTTPLDPDETDGLLLTHITTRDELDRWEQDNILEALAWTDRTKPSDMLHERFLKELHRRMFCNVWKWAGHFRQSDKNIGVPWPQIPVGLRNLFDDTRFWMEKEESPDEVAARLHHRLVRVHPFPNGNGRHGRLMADLLLENVLRQPRFTWGGNSLAKPGELRTKYISALRAADDGNYAPLLAFVRS